MTFRTAVHVLATANYPPNLMRGSRLLPEWLIIPGCKRLAFDSVTPQSLPGHRR